MMNSVEIVGNVSDKKHQWGGVDNVLPFSVTTRINANNQQWLRITEDE